jgi:hypothetical protein
MTLLTTCKAAIFREAALRKNEKPTLMKSSKDRNWASRTPGYLLYVSILKALKPTEALF